MRSTILRCALVTGMALMAVAAAGCSSTSEQVSDEIAGQVQDKLDLAEEPTVTCPDDAKAEKGATFTCQVELQKVKIPVKVTFKDDTNFTSSVQGVVFKKPVFEKELIKQIEASDVKVASLDCPTGALVILRTEDTLDCTAVDDQGTKAKVTVGLNDDGDAVIQNITAE